METSRAFSTILGNLEKKRKKISCQPNSLNGTCVAERPVNVFVYCALVESISGEPRTTGHDQSFVLFSNIVLELLPQSFSKLVTIILKGMKNYFKWLINRFFFTM